MDTSEWYVLLWRNSRYEWEVSWRTSRARDKAEADNQRKDRRDLIGCKERDLGKYGLSRRDIFKVLTYEEMRQRYGTEWESMVNDPSWLDEDFSQR